MKARTPGTGLHLSALRTARRQSRGRYARGTILVLLTLSLIGVTFGVPFEGRLAEGADEPVSAAPASGVQDRLPVDLAARPNGLRSMPMEFRPKTRWWWPRIDVDKAEIKRELLAIKRAGFGGVEQVLMRDFDGWDKPLFRENTKYALQVAINLGLSFDITLGPGWPMSAPSADDFDARLSMQDLVHGAIDVVGPVPVTAPLPRPVDNGTRSLELVALTAAQIDPTAPDTANGVVTLNPDSMRDITATVAGEMFTWTPPTGTWRVFAFYMRATGQRPHANQKTTVFSTLLSQLPFDLPEMEEVNEGNLVVDHFSLEATKAAVKDYDRMLFGNDMDALWERSNGMVFEDSIEIGHAGPGNSVALPLGPELRPFWTRDMKREFARRRGYDVTPLLPVTLPEYGLSDGGGARVKRDLRDTLQDLWIDNHMQANADWAKTHGMRTRQQAYGFAGFDHIRGATGAQHPDVETLGFGDPAIVSPQVVLPGPNYNAWGSAEGWAAMDTYREISSGAHLSGADIVSNEWGAALQGHYTMQPTDYVALANRAMSVGVSSQILHGFAYKFFDEPPFSPPWPGWCAWCEAPFAFADSWNQDWPQWPSWRRLNDYVARAQGVLRQGDPRVDVTVLGGRANIADFGVPLSQRGYTYDFLDQQSAAELPLPRGRRLLPGGPSYKALVVAGQATMAGPTARRLLAFARKGLPVVLYGVLPSKGVSYADAAREDKAVQDAVKALLRLPNVRRADTAAALTSALTALRVRPDFRTAWSSNVVPLHRRTAAGDVWFLYNHSTEDVRTTATFAAKGTPFRLDLFTGQASRAGAYRTTTRGTVLPLHLKAGQTAAVIIRRAAPARHATTTTADEAVIRGSRLVITDADGGRVTTRLSNGRTVVSHLPAAPAARALTGPWQVDATLVNPEGRTDVKVTMDHLTDWRQVPELTGQSGRATYTTSFTVPRSWVARGHEVRVDLGNVAGSAEVSVNGRPVNGLSAFSGPRPLTQSLRVGKNTITVRVATTFLNKIAALARSGDPRYAQFNTKLPEESGLLGPVRLVPFARSSIRLR